MKDRAEVRTLSLFEAAAEGERRKDRAIERVDKANLLWVEKAVAVAKEWIELNRMTTAALGSLGEWVVKPEVTITADDIYPGMGGLVASEPRAMGAVMTRLQREGLIEATDRTVKSCRPECHRRPIRVWRVL